MKVHVWGVVELDANDPANTKISLFPTATARTAYTDALPANTADVDGAPLWFTFDERVDYSSDDAAPAPEKKPLIVEVDEFDGEDSGIEIRGAQTFRGGDGLLYCIGLQGNDGVIRFVDYGYRTPEEAKEAWAEAEYLPGRGA